MKNSLRLGRYFFAVAVIASGIQQLIRADFVRLVPKFPAWIHWHSFWARLAGVALIAIGLAIVTGKKQRPAAALLAAMLFLLLTFLYLPQVAANPKAGFMWTNPCKTLALLGGALLLTRIRREETSAQRAGRDTPPAKLALLASIFLGVFLFVCGVQHFVYTDFVVTLVPKWLPGSGQFWAYFTGIALIAGGLGVILPKTARWAAALSGTMIFLWFLLLHIPRALANLQDAGEMAGVFEALALSGVAFLVCGSRPRKQAQP